jgi:hypothetical protein
VKPRNNLHIFEVRSKYFNVIMASYLDFIHCLWFEIHNFGHTTWQNRYLPFVKATVSWDMMPRGVLHGGSVFLWKLMCIAQISWHHILEDSYSHSCENLSPYYSCSHNCKKQLLASSSLSVCPLGTSLLPLNGFSCNLMFENFLKLCQENWSFIKIWQE